MINRKLSHLLSFAATALVQTLSPVFAHSLPASGTVTGGNASISSTTNTTTINQTSQRAVIDWNSFNVGTNETVQFLQPSTTAIALNRIHDSGTSAIDGKILANGNVWLLNPNGILFGKNSRINVGGLLATTSNISNDDFMAGKFNFTPGPGNNPNASITNDGTITIADTGLATLVAPNVVNNGTIEARLGKVQLGAGDAYTVDIYGDGLINLQASPAITSQLVANHGIIAADGGTVTLTAAAASTVVNSLVNMDGLIEATSVDGHTGNVTLYAEGSNAVQNNVAASKAILAGNSTVLVSGTIDASGYASGQTGGTVQLLGDHVGLLTGATIDVSGDVSGGTVRVGGDFHGAGTTSTALDTIVQSGTSIKANAVTSGDGGNVTVWADDNTDFAGTIQARGGTVSGNGGYVETSGHNTLTAAGDVNASAAHGNAGTWLLDPTAITITTATANVSGDPNFTNSATGSTLNATTVSNDLSAGTSVTVTTSGSFPGDIIVSSAITDTGTGAASLTLNSGSGNIGINNTIGNTAGTFTLNLLSTGTITQSAAITANALSVSGSGGTATLTNTSNAIGSVAASMGTGTFNLNDGSTSFSIDTVNGITGISATNVYLNDLGTVSQTQNITATNLLLQGNTGTYNLNNTGNSVTELASNMLSTSTVSFADNGGFDIGTVNGTAGLTARNVFLRSSGTVTQSQIINAANVSFGLAGDTTGTYNLTNLGNAITSISAAGGTLNAYSTAGFNITTENGLGGIFATNVNLQTTGAITESKQIVATNVSLSGSGGTYTLTNISNDISNLAASVGTGTVTLNNSTFNLALGTVNSIIGITAGTFNLTDTGTVTQSQAINATNASFSGSGGTYTLTTGAADNIGTISGSVGTGKISLNNGSNNLVIGAVNGINGITAGQFNLIDNGGTVTQTQAIAANVSLSGTAPTYTLTNASNNIGTLAASIGTGTASVNDGANALAIGSVNGVNGITAGTFNLTDTSTVTQSQAIAATNFSLSGTGGTDTLTNTSNNIGTVAANTGSLNLVNGNNNLTVGSVNSINGITTTGTTSLSAGTGTLTTSQAIAVGSGNLNLTADNMSIGAALSGTGTVTFLPSTTTRMVCLNYTTGCGTALSLTTASLGNLTDGWAGIAIGATGNITSPLNMGATSWTDPVSFLGFNQRNVNGALVGTGNASFTFNGPNTTTLNSNVTTADQLVSISSNLSFNNSTVTTNGGAFLFSPFAMFVDTSTGNLTVNTSGGNITFTQIHGTSADTGKTLNLNAGTGTIAFNGNVDGAETITATGGNITFGSTKVWGSTATLGTTSLTSSSNIALPTFTGTNLYVNDTGTITQAGAITATSAAFSGSGATYTLTNASNAIGTVAASIGTGTLNIADNIASMVVGTVNSITGITGGTVTLANTGGNVTISNAINQSGTGTNTLTVKASTDILQNAAITNGGGVYNVTLDADTANAGGAINITAGISTNGGAIVLGGGATPTTGAAVGDAAQVNGITITSAPINAGSGTITMNGTGYAGGTGSDYGVNITGSSANVTASGNIAITGTGGSNASSNDIGVILQSGGHITGTGSGAITVNGTGAGSGTGGNNYGVELTGASAAITNANGTIGITGQGGGGSGGSNYGVYITGTDTTTNITTANGNISLTGTGGGTGNNDYGIYVSGTGTTNGVNPFIKSTGTGSLTLTGTKAGSTTIGILVANTAAAMVDLLTTTKDINLFSTGDIFIGNTSTGATSGGISTTGGNVLLDANYLSATPTFGVVDVQGSIGTGGGNITLGAGTTPLTTAAVGDAAIRFGVGLTGVFNACSGSCTGAGSGGNITLNGAGEASTGTNTAGVIGNSATIETNGAGTITMTGTGGSGSSGAGNYGIKLQGNTVVSTVTGAITITGTGGNTTGGGDQGVSIDSASVVKATGAGNITITGTGKGTGIGGDDGIILGINTSSITSAGGNISLTGTGSTTDTVGNDIGIALLGHVSTTGNGTITINGTGGGTGAASGNYGVELSGTNAFISDANGVLGITGQGGGGSGGSNYGIYVTGSDNTTNITTTGTGANITLNGTGGGTGGTDYGIYYNGTGTSSDPLITATGTGSITLTGTQSGTSAVGIDLNNTNLALGIVTGGTGSVTVNSNKDIYMNGLSITTVGGNVTFDTDYLDAVPTAGSIIYTGHLVTGGGNVTMGGGTNPLTTAAIGDAASNSGVLLQSVINACTGSCTGTTGGGNITLNGTGSATAQVGVNLANLTLETNGTGTININGTGGASGAANDLGVRLSATTVSAVNGTITINGTGGNTTGGGNVGVFFNSAATDSITTTGTGAISITGTGKGTGIGGDDGILLGSNTNSVSSTGGGNISLTGTGSTTDTIGNDIGLALLGPVSTTGSGTITINGTGGGTGAAGNNYGIELSGSTVSDATGALALNGTGGSGTGGNNYGIYLLGTTPGISTSGGNINLTATGAINLASNSTINSGTTGSVGVTLSSGIADITLGSITGDGILIQNSGSGNINLGGTLTSKPSSSITLVTNGNFINTAGAGALVPGTGGHFFIYSTNPTNNTLDGITGNYNRYSCTYGGSCPTLGTGNGLLYSFTPQLTATPTAVNITYGDTAPNLTGYAYAITGYLSSDATGDTVTGSLTGTTNYVQHNDVGNYNINYSSGSLASALGYSFTTYANNSSGVVVGAKTITASLSGSVDKEYDGNLTATLAAGNYNLPGILTGDTITISNTSSTYDTKDAGTGKTVSVAGLSLSGAQDGDYVLSATTASGAVGEIDAKTITASLTGTTDKVYDGGLIASLGAGNYSLPGIISGDTVTLNNPTAGLYDTKDVGTGKTVSVTGLSLSGAQNADYVLSSTSASAAIGEIDAKTLTASLHGLVDKTYDGNTTATLVAGNYNLPGVLSGDTVTVAGTSSAYDTKDAGTGKTVSVSGLSLSGAQGNDYVLSATTASGAVGEIDAKTITASLTGTTDKVYDGGVIASLATGNYSLPGVISGDTVTLNNPVNGTYDTKDAGTGKTVSVTGLSLSGAQNADYVLSSTNASGAIGEIDAKTLTVSLQGLVDKTYDGTNAAALAANNFHLGGLLTGDAVTVADTSSTYDTKNVGTGKTVSVSGLSLSGAQSSDYVLSSNSTSAVVGEVDAKALTVTANDTTGISGQSNPTFSGTITGFVTGETASVLTTQPTYNSAANTASSPAGTYDIVASGAAAQNYLFNYINGIFTILPPGSVLPTPAPTPPTTLAQTVLSTTVVISLNTPDPLPSSNLTVPSLNPWQNTPGGTGVTSPLTLFLGSQQLGIYIAPQPIQLSYINLRSEESGL